MTSYLYQITEGRITESDSEYRERFNKLAQGLGTNTEASIIAEVLKIDGAYACIIKRNYTDGDIILSSGLTLAKDTYAVIVHADSSLSNEVAQAIFRKMPFGIRQSGLEMIEVEDEAGEIHNVKFTFVKEQIIDVYIKCKVSDEFENGGADKIRDNIKSYINNRGVGKSAIYSKFYECTHDVSGIEDILDLTINGVKENISVSAIDIVKCGQIIVDIAEV